jgi:hypothetical protein
MAATGAAGFVLLPVEAVAVSAYEHGSLMIV